MASMMESFQNPDDIDRRALLSQLRSKPQAAAGGVPASGDPRVTDMRYRGNEMGMDQSGLRDSVQSALESRQGSIMAPGAAAGGITQAGDAVAAPARDTSKWNTDGYAKPSYVPEKFASHPPPGWDREKWANPDHQTPKYAVGRILSNFAPKTENGAAAAAEVAKAYPGTTYNGKDKITIPGVGTIDFIQAASVGGKGWRWGTEAHDAAVNARQGAVQNAANSLDASGMSSGDSVQALTEDSTWKRLMARMNQINGPEATDRNALMSLLTK